MVKNEQKSFLNIFKYNRVNFNKSSCLSKFMNSGIRQDPVDLNDLKEVKTKNTF